MGALLGAAAWSLKLYFTAIHGGKAEGRGIEGRRYSAAPRQAAKPAWMGGMDAAGSVRGAQRRGVEGWRYSAAPRQAAKPAWTPVWQHSASD